MIATVAKLTVKKGSEERLESVMKTLAEQVRANEPDAIFYEPFRSRKDPSVFHVLEIYASEEALTRHMETPHLLAARPEFAACLAAPPEMEIFDSVRDPDT